MYAADVLRESDLTPLHKLQEIKYWYIDRKTRKFIPWVARKLPESVKYWVVIHGMVTVEPNKNPMGVTGAQLLELWKKGGEGHG